VLYGAALRLSTIVLRVHDLRVGKIGHHRETLRAVVGFVPAELQVEVAAFERARRKRNILVYERVGVVSEADLAGLRESVNAFEPWVREQAERHLRRAVG